MISKWIFGLTACVLAFACIGATKGYSSQENDWAKYVREATVPCRLVILATSRNFLSLKKQALNISQRTGINFSMEGWVFDQKRGLIDPSSEDNQYVPRRESEDFDTGKPFISIERTDFYPHMKSGYYIIVGNICFSAHDARRALAKFHHVVPQAYTQKTTVYMGCRS